jgi:hypothetical protein
MGYYRAIIDVELNDMGIFQPIHARLTMKKASVSSSLFASGDFLIAIPPNHLLKFRQEITA